MQLAAGLAQAGSPIAVLGAGSWGTALAIQFARSGKATRLWGRDPLQMAEMVRERANRRYLPQGHFPESLSVGADLDSTLAGALDVLVVVPSDSFRAILGQIRPLLAPQMRLAWATKGFEAQSGLLPQQVARDTLGTGRAFAVLSGPTFAAEVGAGLPTAMTVASADAAFAAALAQDLSSPSFRAYTSTDIVGVEVGGAVKNVLALAAGLSDGLGFGANSRIALITRGLTEMVRLGVALGAKRETFMGLAGLGDLVLSCTDDQSRNRRFGLLLAQGRNIEQARAEIGQVVEGVRAARAVRAVAQRENVDMPLCEGVYRVLYEGLPADEVVRTLMRQPIRAEAE
ncbi:MAG TPA: NAD(P)H-dependent glycerol-3-phosphate dehydrogenase [Steroidobacteraceae bacterium]|nr:NAD(P)H-dependent glycerol-3-phosphate dehydrogenase [Steroidobacteraceae bacterium]